MSSIRRQDSIAASAVVDDQLEASNIRLQLRTAKRDGVVTVAMTQSAVGLNVDLIIGDMVISSSAQPVVKSIAPVLPDDLFGSFAIAKGDQVALAVRNTTLGAINLGYIFDVP